MVSARDFAISFLCEEKSDSAKSRVPDWTHARLFFCALTFCSQSFIIMFAEFVASSAWGSDKKNIWEGAVMQKLPMNAERAKFYRRMDQRTDWLTDRAGYGVACTRLNIRWLYVSIWLSLLLFLWVYFHLPICLYLRLSISFNLSQSIHPSHPVWPSIFVGPYICLSLFSRSLWYGACVCLYVCVCVCVCVCVYVCVYIFIMSAPTEIIIKDFLFWPFQ